MSIRESIFRLIDEENKETKASRAFNLFIVVLIVLNVLAITAESFNSIRNSYEAILQGFELFSIIVFSAEYILRLITADLKYKKASKLMSTVSFVRSPMAIIDLLAVLPAYLPLLIPIDLRFVRILRLLRVARVFKLNRYSSSLKLISDVFKEKRTELGVTLFVTFILLVIASTLMYYIERVHQPDAFPNIIASFWWAVATLTTVGYGDVYPVTGWGKFISGVIALLGIGMVALPTGILSSAFMGKIESRKANLSNEVCPACGQEMLNAQEEDKSKSINQSNHGNL